MSWRSSLHYWDCGPVYVHVFCHALEPMRRFVTVGWSRYDWYVWPWRGYRLFRAISGRGTDPRYRPDELIVTGSPVTLSRAAMRAKILTMVRDAERKGA